MNAFLKKWEGKKIPKVELLKQIQDNRVKIEPIALYPSGTPMPGEYTLEEYMAFRETEIEARPLNRGR